TTTGDGYTFGGNAINLSNYWQFASANNTVTANINYANAGSTSMTISPGATGNIINGNIDLALTAGGDMNTSVDEDINHNGAITGSTDIFQQGTETNTWISSATNASTFTASGGVSIASGAFQCRNANCFGNNANSVETNTTGAIQFNNVSMTVANSITFNSSTSPQLNQMPGSTTLSGTININSTGTLYTQSGGTVIGSGSWVLNANANSLGSSSATSLLDITGVVSGTGGFNVTTGELILIGNNTYSGVTTVNSGGLVAVVHVNGLGSTTGNTVVNTGGSLLFGVLSPQVIAAEPITINGDGISSSYGAIRNQGANRELPGAITLGSDSTVTNGGATTDLDLSGVVGGTGNLTLFGVAEDYDVNLAGASPNTLSGDVTFISGGGVVANKGTISTGNITIHGIDDTLVNTATNSLGDAAIVSFTGAFTPTLDLAVAATDTIGGLSSLSGIGS
ncbi:MAG: hypothetical protein AAB914_00535, partial [Patescibacteria group bacterium]